MSIVLAIVLWLGALALFLLLAGGVRRGDEMRARAQAARLQQHVDDALEAEPAAGGGRLAAPPRASRPGPDGLRPVSAEPRSRSGKRLTG
ncbi:MAG: hypothetical protein QNK04_09600 [Myxococcota bacterium]|nr:hypothetical protein [Myxococcota bacterium]